ncbi:MAG: hypothetical protein JWO82_504 [Akkermansiaceae bacterium]|nr:hypothetical protein [Akkermansiaceae bacterium]
MKVRVQSSGRGFTILEMSMVVCLILILITMSFFGWRGVDTWKKGKAASESLRTAYIAQRAYLADNPTAKVANLTQAMLQPYLPNNAATFPVITSLTGATLAIRVNVSPPYATDGSATTGNRYDPSGSTTDLLWDVGE